MLDQYVQAATIAVEKDRVAVRLRLVPGVEVFRTVLAAIDTDGDGAISEAERRAYAERVTAELSLAVDGQPLRPRLVSWTFPAIEEMREGYGTIRLNLEAELPPGGPARRLVFENRHSIANPAYLVNCLVPQDPLIRVAAQTRNDRQSLYQLDYVQSAAGTSPAPSAAGAGDPSSPPARVGMRGVGGWLAAGALLVSAGVMFLCRRGSRRRVRSGASVHVPSDDAGFPA